ncbi:MAG: T9SS type A sorting domain-containing protein [Bacteroidota bacterium]
MRVVVAVLLLLCPLSLVAQSPIQERFFTDKSTYEYGEAITVYYHRYNPSDDSLTYTNDGSCEPFREFDGLEARSYCLPMSFQGTLGPNAGTESAFVIEPSLQGFPASDGTTHTITVRGEFVTQTLTINAPQYLGGLLSVDLADGASPGEVEAIREALNVTDVTISSPNTSAGTYWQIEGVTPEQAVAEYGDNPLFDWFEATRPQPDELWSLRKLVEVDDDVVVTAALEGGERGGFLFQEDATLTLSVALTNHTDAPLRLAYPGGLEATYELFTVGPDPERVSGIDCYCFGVTETHDRDVQPSERVAWPEGENDARCFSYVPRECGVGEGDYILNAYATDYYEPVSFSVRVVPAVANEPDDTPVGTALTAAPNPFSASTTLSLTLTNAKNIEAVAYDVLGRRVAVLHEGVLAAGTHALSFEAARLPAGVYVVRVLGDDLALTRRVTLAR